MGGPGSGRKKGTASKAFVTAAKAKQNADIKSGYSPKSKKAFRKDYVSTKKVKGAKQLSPKEAKKFERKLNSLYKTGAG